MHNTPARSRCLTDAVLYLSSNIKTPTVFLYAVCYWNVLVVLKREHMVACFTAAASRSLSLPAWCAPVGLEKCHQQPARQAAHFCSYTSLLKEDFVMSQWYSTNTRPKQMWAVTKVIWGWCFFLQNLQKFECFSVSWNASLAKHKLPKSAGGHLPRLWLWLARGMELAGLRMALCPAPLCLYHQLGFLG